MKLLLQDRAEIVRSLKLAFTLSRCKGLPGTREGVEAE
jgi:hypothetical protein